VHADGGVDPNEPFDGGERTFRRSDVPAGDEDPLDARQARSADDLVRVGLESVGVEMAVAVDEGRQEPASW
jgi:hypothetical protein